MTTTIALPGADWQPHRETYLRFSTLTGAVTSPPAEPSVTVRFRPLAVDREIWVLLPFVGVTLTLAATFAIWLFLPGHLPVRTPDMSLVTWVGDWVMVASLVVVEILHAVLTGTLCWSALRARDPIPMQAQSGLKVAFITTVVPDREPLEVLETTLRAARQVRHANGIDVWLLDEGNSPEVRALCARLGVHHFSRKGRPEFNTPSGAFKAKTKHGNINAWRVAVADVAGYDVVMGVDPDHAPLPNAAERMLGYFRDRDVAFVCGPQVYGNARTFLTRCSESQAYVFQSIIQRAANASLCAMLVGTNNAWSTAALRACGGFQDSITEDMATSLRIHGSVNPVTGRRWKSVYTPDVIAVGEGPTTWTDYFSQQLRWARGADELWASSALGLLRRLTWRQGFHYALMMAYYPIMGLTWLLGGLLLLLPVLLGSSGLHVGGTLYLSMYGNLALCQVGLYAWLRRYNVSPHEPTGSSGIRGMFLSAITAPIYVRALVATVLRRAPRFVVTPKGRSASTDHWQVFRANLGWTALPLGALLIAVASGRTSPALVGWVVVLLCTCLAAPVAWWISLLPAPRSPAPAPDPAHVYPEAARS